MFNVQKNVKNTLNGKSTLQKILMEKIMTVSEVMLVYGIIFPSFFPVFFLQNFYKVYEILF